MLSKYNYLESKFNISVTSPTSQLILQPSRRFTYVTVHSPTLPSLRLRHSSFSNPSVASPTSQLILQPFFRFSYVTGSSITSPGKPPMMYVYFSNLCHFTYVTDHKLSRCFTYVTAHSPTLVSLFLRHRLFTYVTWRAAHDICILLQPLSLHLRHRS